MVRGIDGRQDQERSVIRTGYPGSGHRAASGHQGQSAGLSPHRSLARSPAPYANRPPIGDSLPLSHSHTPSRSPRSLQNGRADQLRPRMLRTRTLRARAQRGPIAAAFSPAPLQRCSTASSTRTCRRAGSSPRVCSPQRRQGCKCVHGPRYDIWQHARCSR